MRRSRSVFVTLAITIAAAAFAAATLGNAGGDGTKEDETTMASKLEAGSPAPPFSLTGSDGKTYRLEDFTGKNAVVIAWFPKAFTGG